MGRKKKKIVVTKKTKVSGIPWIPEELAEAFLANGFPTLGTLRTGLGQADTRRKIVELIKKNAKDGPHAVEPIVRAIDQFGDRDRRRTNSDHPAAHTYVTP